MGVYVGISCKGGEHVTPLASYVGPVVVEGVTPEPSTRRAEARRPLKERPRTRCLGDKTDPQKIPARYLEGGF